MAPAIEVTDTEHLVSEVADAVAAATHATVIAAMRRSEVCGCPGCRAEAQQAVVWAAALLGEEAVFGW